MTAAERPLLRTLSAESRPLDPVLLALVPVVLIGAFQLPYATRVTFAFDVSEPTVVTAYTSYFVHLTWPHLLGNVLVYLVVGPLSYLLLVLSGRRRLFWWSLITFLTAFPFALSTLQLVFPRARLLVGFSGLNAALFGLLCFSIVGYAGATIAAGLDDRHSPILLFFTVAAIALVSVPSRAWPTEIAAASSCFGLAFLAAAVRESGLPDREALKAAIDSPGYVELGGGALGVLFAYPIVGFQDTVIAGVGTVDAYVHLLGYCLAFIVVYAFVMVVEVDGPGSGETLSEDGRSYADSSRRPVDN